MFPKTLASEFPHDNPELSDGAVWVCASPCAAPLPSVPGVLIRAKPVVSHPPRAPMRVVSAATDTAPPPVQPAAQGPFERFVAAMTRIALEAGATRAAAELPRVLSEGRLVATALGEPAERALVMRGYLDPGTKSPAESLLRAVRAWRGVLEGTSSDFSGCGEQTLDEWAASLLAACIGAEPATKETLRKRLRQAGVAAFGMREAA